MLKLSEDLHPILQAELAQGNRIIRIDEPAGTNCPYAVVLKDPLRKSKIEQNRLPPSVKYWESRDYHYPTEAGYYSEFSKHVISGPIGTR